MRYEIEPYVGVGPIKFGMAPGEVEGAMGAPPRRRFKKLPEDIDESERFSDFFVYYDGGRCDAVECSMADGDFLMQVLPEVFSGSGVPFFASFDLLPLFEAMAAGDGIVCLQHYGDGMAAYLMRKES